MSEISVSGSQLESPRWFVLNHIGTALQDMAKKTVERFNALSDASLELFAPTYVIREQSHGELRMRTANLTFHYVFVRGTLPEVKKLCGQDNGFSFLIDRGSAERRYAIIGDRDMANFKNIARAYKNCLPYFPLDDIDLEEGDLVEVIRGDFPGLIGTYMPKAKGRSGNIVLNVYNNVGTIAFDIKATDVRVIEFSKKCTRANDQIDAIVPHLFKALRLHHAGEALSAALVARLSVFCSRMEVVRLDTRKLDARLQAILFAANRILGNNDGAMRAQAKFENLKDAVTNEWTSALLLLIFAVMAGNTARLENVLGRLRSLKPASKAQQVLIEEYEFYALSSNER